MLVLISTGIQIHTHVVIVQNMMRINSVKHHSTVITSGKAQMRIINEGIKR